MTVVRHVSTCVCSLVVLLSYLVRDFVLTGVKIQVSVLWVVTPCNDVEGYHRFGSVHPEDGGSIDLRNVGTLPHH
jgi:hypothetical protein